VDAVVAAPADEVRARVGRWASIDESVDGTCKLHISTDSLDWVALALGAMGADFTFHGPPELVEYLRSWAERFTRAITNRDARLD
jgi:NAD-dependent oxidoreductase involved in siderophore biosynthesis